MSTPVSSAPLAASEAEPGDDLLREVALTREEYRVACGRLGRTPNALELGIIGGMWSEHCSYKHSRHLLSRFPTQGPRVLMGAGEENAGAVDIGDGLAIVMKVESHNHPSAVEPFQGAATGVGGILRDIFTMGARPIALLDSLRFGPLDSPRSRHLAEGIIAGIGWYGNCVGVPTVGGEVMVAEAYAGNPLVNAMAVGIMRHEDLRRSAARGVGNAVILFGADTGRDGVHGATFASLTDPDTSHRGVVQVGDPFLEKLRIEACLGLLGQPGLVGLQDLGATGLTSATVEAAHRAGSGMVIDIADVPLRATGMAPYEVMLSESQERMLAIVEQGTEAAFLARFRDAGLHAATIGRVSETAALQVRSGDELLADLPIDMLVNAPAVRPPVERPVWLDDVQRLDNEHVPMPADLTATFLELLAAPDIASREPVFSRYDQMVGTNTVIAPGGDAALLRVKGTARAIALATDGNGRLCFLDPRQGGRIAVAEAARNVSCTGATPIAVTDCLNFGSPEDPAVAYQMAEVIEGLADACEAFGVPVVSGNVSLYNDSRGVPVWPTPVVGMLGLLEDVSRRCDSGFRAEGDAVLLLGETLPDLSGSAYLAHAHGRVAGAPSIDLEREVALQVLVRALIAEGLLRSAHDCSDGGLAVALAESAFRSGLGLRCPDVGDHLRPDTALFAETQSRVVVSVAPGDRAELERRASAAGVPATPLGQVGGVRLVLGEVDVALETARAAWSTGLARALGGAA
ncbi:phosphoribosylformylglycinamidine synthase subunit PurL [soil metagenome]